LGASPTGATSVTLGSTASKFNRLEKKEKPMIMISNVEPDLRQVIQNLRDGNLEKAKDRTVELIEHTLRMSGPMYREETTQPGQQRGRPAHNRAAGKLRILTKDLRDISFTMRRGTQADALEMAERALVVFLRPEAVARTLVASPPAGGTSLGSPSRRSAPTKYL
jgi:hypothetical protein